MIIFWMSFWGEGHKGDSGSWVYIRGGVGGEGREEGGVKCPLPSKLVAGCPGHLGVRTVPAGEAMPLGQRWRGKNDDSIYHSVHSDS